MMSSEVTWVTMRTAAKSSQDATADDHLPLPTGEKKVQHAEDDRPLSSARARQPSMLHGLHHAAVVVTEEAQGQAAVGNRTSFDHASSSESVLDPGRSRAAEREN
jgi:hypothetical protein